MTEKSGLTRLKKWYDRRGDDALSTFFDKLPWRTRGTRGALNLARDSAQHRRYHSHYEDLLN